MDPKSKRTYYVDHSTKRTTWEHPAKISSTTGDNSLGPLPVRPFTIFLLDHYATCVCLYTSHTAQSVPQLILLATIYHIFHGLSMCKEAPLCTFAITHATCIDLYKNLMCYILKEFPTFFSVDWLGNEADEGWPHVLR